MKITNKMAQQVGITNRYPHIATMHLIISGGSIYHLEVPFSYGIAYKTTMIGYLLATLLFIPNIFRGGILAAAEELWNTLSRPIISSDSIDEKRGKELVKLFYAKKKPLLDLKNYRNK